MDDDLHEEPLGEGEAAPDEFVQEGPDLFGAEPDELVLPGEPNPPDDPEVDVELDETSEIPIDPDDEDEGVEGPGLDPVPDAQSDEQPEPGEQPAPEQQPEPEASVAAQPADVGPTARASEAPEPPLALYRRYRPETFAEVIGQEHVTEPLQRALVNNRVNHAYLFSGPRGCGKTTSARILARCLNCEQGPTPTPCGVCQSCRDLARGGAGSIDVIEIDAASHGGVDEARDLRERAFFAPVSSRYKIYIIDEAHMVTTQGFNALLKVVEEPPPHVKFIFATTEPEKVIGTIRSRTHHYPFRLVPPKVLQGYLASLCEAEGVSVDPTVLPLVVRAGAGSVRDSLSVLDQLLGGAGEQGVTYRQATALLGYTPDTLLDEIMDEFAAGDAEGVFSCIDKVIEVGQDPRRFAEDLLRRLRDLIIVAAVPDALTSGLVDVSGDQAERLTTQARGMGPGELTRAAEVIAKGLTDMRGTTAPRLHLELMCSRVLLPGADVDARGIHARLDRLERRLLIPGEQDAAVPALSDAPGSAPATPGGRGAAPSAPGSAEGPAGRAPESAGRPTEQAERGPEPAGRRPAQAGRGSEPAVGGPEQGGRGAEQARRAPAQEERPPSAAGPAPEASPTGPPASGDLQTADVRRLWPQVLEAVKTRRRVTWIILSQNAQVHEFAGGVLTLAANNPGARESLTRGGHEDVLREAVLEVLGAAPRVEVIVAEGGPTPPPPAASGPAGPRGGQGSSGGGPAAGGQGPSGGRGGGQGPSGAQGAGGGPSRGTAGPAGGENSGPRGRRWEASGHGGAGQHEQSRQGGPAGPRDGVRGGSQRPADPRARRDYPATPPTPPPEEDEGPPPDYAAAARGNILPTQHTPPRREEEAEPDRRDRDLDNPDIEVDDLLRTQLGAELIAEDDGSGR